MNTNSIPSLDITQTYQSLSQQATFKPTSGDGDKLKEAFTEFVGESLFGQMLSSMRDTVKQPAYFGGGQAEKIFQQQMDQVLVEKITDASAERIAEPMLELFRLGRPS